MPGGVELVWLEPGDPRRALEDDLRYAVLYEPFGVGRDAMWSACDDEVLHLAAIEDDRLVGCGCLVLDAVGARLRQMAVAPDRRGRGIGTAIARALVGEARERGAGHIWLDARVGHEGFYWGLGFEVSSGTFPSGGTGLPHVRMILG